MNQISKEALDFLNEARKAFSKNSNLTTYRCEKESFIALRGGFRDDCIMVYELGNPVGNFTQQLDKQHKVLVDHDEIDKVRKLKEIVEKNIEKVDENLECSIKEKHYHHNKGFKSALELVLGLVSDIGIDK
jgi:hypothetical protein